MIDDEISSKAQDLLSVITNRAMSWLFASRWYQIKTDMNLKTDLVKGRRENVIPQTGKCRLPVVGVKNIKKRPTTDHLPHINEKATSVRETKVKSTHDQRNASYTSSFQPKKSHDRFETIYRIYLSHKEKVISPWIHGPFHYIRSTYPRVRPPFRPSGY
jgi:hypothetical protein